MLKKAQKDLEEKKKYIFKDYEDKKKARSKRRFSRNFILRRRKKERERQEGQLDTFDLNLKNF
jgi:hypothetical protein